MTNISQKLANSSHDTGTCNCSETSPKESHQQYCSHIAVKEQRLIPSYRRYCKLIDIRNFLLSTTKSFPRCKKGHKLSMKYWNSDFNEITLQTLKTTPHSQRKVTKQHFLPINNRFLFNYSNNMNIILPTNLNLIRTGWK